jgi:DNA-binding transcriptional MerR regulator
MTLPDKIYFKIGEVARLTGVKPYVLRYWETEFKAIQPVKSRSRQRLYRKRDVELIVKIKELLYKQRFTIEGARKKIREVLGEGELAALDAAPATAPEMAPGIVSSDAIRLARALATEILAIASRPL